MKFIIIVLTSLISSKAMTAQDSTRVFVNTKKAVEAIIKPGDAEAILYIKNSCVKKMNALFIQINGEHVSSETYKRSLQFSEDDNGTVEETVNTPGHFTLPYTDIKKQLMAGKSVSLYLLLNPANPMMMIRSQRIFVGKMAMK